MTITAAAPSLSGLEFPAVTVPSSLNTGFSFASASSVESRRGPSSVSTTVSPLRPFTVTGTVSSSKRPASIAATAFSWLCSANRSWRTRGISRSSARFSAVMPSGSVWPRRSISGLVMRQPSVVS